VKIIRSIWIHRVGRIRIALILKLFVHIQRDSLARKPKHSSITSSFWHGSLWKSTWTKLTSNKAYFQQDGATRHTFNASMRETESFFGDRKICGRQDHQTWRHLISSCGVYWRTVYTVLSSEQLTPTKTRYGGMSLPLPVPHYQMSSPICRHAYKCLEAGRSNFQHMLRADLVLQHTR
jgi:hypothetical protein